jgi:hypothetical protein
MSHRHIITALLMLGLFCVAVGALSCSAERKFQDTFNVDKINLADKGSNTYMFLKPGFKLILTDGKDSLIITVLDETRIVDGVRTRIVEERETKGGKLDEVSRNYFAIDKATGDIYYFGEDGIIRSSRRGWLWIERKLSASAKRLKYPLGRSKTA